VIRDANRRAGQVSTSRGAPQGARVRTRRRAAVVGHAVGRVAHTDMSAATRANTPANEVAIGQPASGGRRGPVSPPSVQRNQDRQGLARAIGRSPKWRSPSDRNRMSSKDIDPYWSPITQQGVPAQTGVKRSRSGNVTAKPFDECGNLFGAGIPVKPGIGAIAGPNVDAATCMMNDETSRWNDFPARRTLALGRRRA